MPTPAQCPDCGNTPVNHFVEKVNATIATFEEFLEFLPHGDGFFTAFGNTLWPSFSSYLFPLLFKSLAVMRLGTIVYEPDATTHDRARCVWLEAKKRGIQMWEFRLLGVGRELFVAEIKTRMMKRTKIIVFNGLPRPTLTLSGKRGLPASLAWVDSKPMLKKKLAMAHIPVARGGTAFTWRQAKEIFGQLKKDVTGNDVTTSITNATTIPCSPLSLATNSVIVKPSTGSRSRHTTTGITDIVGLRAAFKKAKQLSPRVVIEEELIGMVYRGTVIDGKVVGVRRKDPPQVVGDGRRNVRELIEIENQRPERQGPVYGKINIEEFEKSGDKKFEKKIHTIDLDSVPKKGEVIIVSKKTSTSSGGGSTDVTDIAHPDIIALLEKIAVVLDDQLVGVDFIVADITQPLTRASQSTPFGVIECNSLPFINVHLFPLNGKLRDTAGALWDAVLK